MHEIQPEGFCDPLLACLVKPPCLQPVLYYAMPALSVGFGLRRRLAKFSIPSL
jgi:hypothetical protein